MSKYKNPYYTEAGAYPASNVNYYENMEGGIKGGRATEGMRQVGNAGMASGNPYLMAGGAVVNGVAGYADMVNYMKLKAPKIENSYSGDSAPQYDLGDEYNSIGEMQSNSEAFWSGAKKGGLVGGLLMRGKAKKLRTEAQAEIGAAQDRFNTANENYHTGQNAKDTYEVMQSRKKQDAYRSLQGGNAYWSL